MPDRFLCFCLNFLKAELTYNSQPFTNLTFLDVLGVCKEASEVQEFVARSSGRELKKREITLVDTSNSSVGLTLWGDDAKNFDGFAKPVILLKATKVSEFSGGKTLNLIGGSTMKINPDIPEGHKLRGWFDNVGCDKILSSVSARHGVFLKK